MTATAPPVSMGGQVAVAAVHDPETGERLIISGIDGVPGVELIDVYSSRRLWRVFHESYDLCLVPIERNDPAGWSRVRYRGRTHEVRAGHVMLTEPGELHSTLALQNPADHYWVLHIEPAVIAGAVDELGMHAPPHLKNTMAGSPVLFSALCGFYRALAGSDESLERQIRFAACVRVILSEMAETPMRSVPAAPDGLLRARDYLRAQFREHVALEELAAIAGVSRYHFAHAFSRMFGISPHAYQTRLRVSSARVQLRSGVPLSEVDAGFADQAHLTRHFKRIFGIPPGQYARLLRTPV